MAVSLAFGCASTPQEEVRSKHYLELEVWYSVVLDMFRGDNGLGASEINVGFRIPRRLFPSPESVDSLEVRFVPHGNRLVAESAQPVGETNRDSVFLVGRVYHYDDSEIFLVPALSPVRAAVSIANRLSFEPGVRKRIALWVPDDSTEIASYTFDVLPSVLGAPIRIK